MPEIAPLEFKINTVADVRALEHLRRLTLEMLKNPQGDAVELNRRLQAINATLSAGAANAARLVEQLREEKKVIASMGGNTSGLDHQIKALQARHGFKDGGISAQIRNAINSELGLLAGRVPGGRALAGLGTGGLVAGAGLGIAGLGVKEFAEMESALARLRTFSIPESAIESVKQLEELVGTSLPQATEMYIRAINGQSRGLQGLNIELGDNLTRSERIKAINEQLAERSLAHTAERADTLAGKWHAMTKAGKDVLEIVGGMISATGALQGGMAAVTWVFNQLIGVVDKLKGKSNEAGDTIKKVEEVAKAFTLEQVISQYEEAAEAARTLKSEQDELIDAETALDVANIDLAVAKGKMTEDEARIARIQARDRGMTRKLDNEQQMLDALKEQERGKESRATGDLATAWIDQQMAEALPPGADRSAQIKDIESKRAAANAALTAAQQEQRALSARQGVLDVRRQAVGTGTQADLAAAMKELQTRERIEREAKDRALIEKETAELQSRIALDGGDAKSAERLRTLNYRKNLIGIDDPDLTPEQRAAIRAGAQADYDRDRRQSIQGSIPAGARGVLSPQSPALDDGRATPKLPPGTRVIPNIPFNELQQRGYRPIGAGGVDASGIRAATTDGAGQVAQGLHEVAAIVAEGWAYTAREVEVVKADLKLLRNQVVRVQGRHA